MQGKIIEKMIKAKYLFVTCVQKKKKTSNGVYY